MAATVQPQPLSLFCTLAANPSALPKFDTQSCPVAQVMFAGVPSPETNAWFMFISQLGYTNAHAILCLGGIACVIYSLLVTLKSYHRLTQSLDVSAFSRFQILNLTFHLQLFALYCSFLSGFITNVLFVTHAWPIFSALCEVTMFGIQITLYFLTNKAWYSDLKGHYHAILNAFWVTFYVLPSSIYFAVICVHVANDFQSTVSLGNMIKYVSVMLWVLRCLLSGIFLVRGVSIVEGEGPEEQMIRTTNIVFSATTIVTGVLWITFTFNVFCPQIHFKSSTETFILSFLEWSNFTFLALLLVTLSKMVVIETEPKPSNNPTGNPLGPTFSAIGIKEEYLGSTSSIATDQTPLSSTMTITSSTRPAESSLEAMRRLEKRWSMGVISSSRYSDDLYNKTPYSATTATSPQIRLRSPIYSMYSTNQNGCPSRGGFGPGRRSAAVSPGIFASYAQDSELTLFDELQQEEIRQMASKSLVGRKEQQGRIDSWGWMFLIDFAALSIVSGIYVGHWYDVLAGRGPVIGVVTALLLAFSVVILLQLGIGIYNAENISETYRPFMTRKASVIIASLLIALALSITLSNPFGYVIAAWLWPTGVVLCLSSTGKCTTEDRMNPLLESFLSSERVAKLKKVKLSKRSSRIAIQDETSGTELASPLSSKRKASVEAGDLPLSPTSKRFLQSVAKAFVGHVFLISIFCGLQLPVAISLCLVAILCSTGLANNVGKGNSSYIGQVMLWITSIVSIAFLSALAVLPLYAFPYAKGFISTDYKVNVLYSIVDSGISVDVINNAVAAVSLQGFYLAVNVKSPLMGNTMARILEIMQSEKATLMIESDESLQQVIDISKPLCNIRGTISPIFVAKNLQAVKNLVQIGVPVSAIAFSTAVGRQVPFDVQYSALTGFYGLEIVPTETVLFNPWLSDSSRKRSRQIIVKPSFSSMFESQGTNLASVLSGVSALVVTNVYDNVWKLPFLSSSKTVPTLTSNNTNFSLNNKGMNLISWNSVSFGIKWGAACGIPGFLAFTFGLAAYVNEVVKVKQKQDLLEARRNTEKENQWREDYENRYNQLFQPNAGSELSLNSVGQVVHSPTLEETVIGFKLQKVVNIRRAGARIAECVSLIGWFLFALGIGLTGETLYPFSKSFIYIFGICGFASTVASFSLVGQSAEAYLIVLAVVLNVLSLLGAGYVIHYSALLSVGFSNLAMTGAALFAVAKTVSTTLASARHSRIALEMENLMLSLALLVSLGWITIAVGMGRFAVDVGLFNNLPANHGIGPIGAVISTSITSILMAICCWFNIMPVIAVTTGLTIVSLVFIGGLMGESSTACFEQVVWFPSQQLAMFVGGILSTLGLAASIAVRFWSFETEESKKQKLLLKYQYMHSEKMRRKKLKISVQKSRDEDDGDKKPILLPEKPQIFIHIANYKDSWLLWRIGCLFSLFGWLLFLGGFGASFGYPPEGIASGIMLTTFSPVALGSLTLAVLRDSRELAVLGQLIYNLSLLSFGGLLHVSSYILSTYNNLATPPPAIPFAISGSIIYFVSSILVSGGLIYRLKHQYLQFGWFELRYGFQLLSWIMIIAGMSIWINSTTIDSVSETSAILSSILCALAIVSNWIDDNTASFYPPSILASVPNFLTQISYVEVGAALFKSAAFIGTCTSTGKCAGTVAGPSLIVTGSIMYFFAMEVKSVSMLINSTLWRDPELGAEPASDVSESEDSSHSSDSYDSDQSRRSRRKRSRRRRKESPAPKVAPLDIYGLLLSWSALQTAFKCILFGMSTFVSIVGVSIGSRRVDKDWSPQYVGSILLLLTGMLSTILLATWICTGSLVVFGSCLFITLFSLAMAGQVIFWGLTYGAVSFEAGIFAGAFGYSILGTIATVLLLCFGVYEKTKKSGDGWTIPAVYQSFSLIGWFLFVVTFGVGVKDSGIRSIPDFVASLITIAICPAIAFMFWFSSIATVRPLRIALFSMICVVIMTTGSGIHQTGLGFLESVSSTLNSSRIGMMFGLLVILITQIAFLLHRSIVFSKIELFSEEKEKLLENPKLSDEGLSWIYIPTSYQTLNLLLKLSLSASFVTLICYIVSIGLMDPTSVIPPLAIHYTFIVSSLQAILGLVFHCYFHWTSVGMLGTISSILAFASSGAVIYSLAFSNMTLSVVNTAIASSVLTLAFLMTAVVIILHKPYPPVSKDELLTIMHIVLIGMIMIGWLLTIVAIGIRKGGGIPAYVQASISGGITMVSLIIEKRRPGFVIHSMLRTVNVASCALSIVLSGVSFANDVGFLNAYGGIGSQIDMAGSSLIILGCAAYIFALFLHSVRKYDELRPYNEEARESKSSRYSTQAVLGDFEEAEDQSPRSSATESVCDSKSEARSSETSNPTTVSEYSPRSSQSTDATRESHATTEGSNSRTNSDTSLDIETSGSKKSNITITLQGLGSRASIAAALSGIANSLSNRFKKLSPRQSIDSQKPSRPIQLTGEQKDIRSPQPSTVESQASPRDSEVAMSDSRSSESSKSEISHKSDSKSPASAKSSKESLDKEAVAVIKVTSSKHPSAPTLKPTTSPLMSLDEINI